MSQIPENGVVFHADGPGFVEVADLPHSGICNIAVVRDVSYDPRTNEWHVRKTTNASETGDTENESHEITIAKHLNAADAFGFAELKGWATYQNTISTSEKVHVSYWRWYNSGTVKDLIERCRKASLAVPEPVLWNILKKMLRIIRGFHDVGVAHGDAHDANWLFHLVKSNYVNPELRLADYGLAQIRSVSGHTEAWMHSCRLDYYMVCEIIHDLSKTATYGTLIPPGEEVQRQLGRPYSVNLRTVLDLLKQIEPDRTQPQDQWQHTAEQVNELVSKKKLGDQTLSNAWRRLDVRSLRNPPLPAGANWTPRPLATVLKSFTENNRKRPVKFWCAEAARPGPLKVLSITHPPKEYRTTYRNVTNMESLPDDWSYMQQDMAAKYHIDPFEDPENIDYTVVNPGRIDTAF